MRSEMWVCGCLHEAALVWMCRVFPGRCSKMPWAAWTWMGSFLLSTGRTAAKSPPMTSSSCLLTSGSESFPLLKCLIKLCGPVICFFLKCVLHLYQLILVLYFNLVFLIRPEKSKLQTIPGQLNVTIECVPPDFSSMLTFLPKWPQVDSLQEFPQKFPSPSSRYGDFLLCSRQALRGWLWFSVSGGRGVSPSGGQVQLPFHHLQEPALHLPAAAQIWQPEDLHQGVWRDDVWIANHISLMRLSGSLSLMSCSLLMECSSTPG